MSTRLDYDVLVAGGGPVGLLLATELRLAGVRVLVVERLRELDTTNKAGAINTASVAAFERRGLLPALLAAAEQSPFLDKGKRSPFVGHFGGILVPAAPVDPDDPSLRGHGPDWYLHIQQIELERFLGQYATELGLEVRRGVEVTGFEADEDGVTVHLDDGEVRVAWLVGCDGGRSLVRRQGGFDFPGAEPTMTARQAAGTVVGADLLGSGWQHTPTGMYVYGPKPGWMRTFELDGPPADRAAPVTAAEMEASLRRVSGQDVRVTEVAPGGTRFTDHTRQTSTYRRGRVLLCGDAAHVHPPFSGQGLNLGLGDAVNLGWKLAATVHGWAPDGLLDTYTGERHPIGAWVLEWTRSQVAVMRGDPYSTALRGLVADFLGTGDGATYYARRVSGLWQHYDLGEGHPLTGALMPALQFEDGTRLAEHTRGGRALLVDLTGDEDLAELARPYADRLDLVRGKANGAGLSGLLVRPDGFVAWAADSGDLAGLAVALKRWLGTS
ncbi:FAD-dependent monooxygenase [Crossiella cryophila]|uniref:2-polyprenyl-6-methoxyphenol hydroxylase-like FAD-dependent oxidoreductase n=1 Tax=Crossiella cryophila TaxID=43355 RepID=A0A7W7CDR7_9PSEU|nr:FAD-dependent monooxygenase [Crossiella cryophila]MBB4679317.1 2-polyprenyl-6-methoxyphenol hydroxylase-like FAD-dependent oxidoreductase [Crossiella cryophila]